LSDPGVISRIAKKIGITRSGVECRLKIARVPKPWAKQPEEVLLAAATKGKRKTRAKRAEGNGKAVPSDLQARVMGAIAILERQEKRVLASGSKRCSPMERGILNAVAVLRGDDD